MELPNSNAAAFSIELLIVESEAPFTVSEIETVRTPSFTD